MTDWLARATTSIATTAANADSRKARRWRVHFPKLAPVEVWFTPEATQAEALAACQGAIDAKPLHDVPKRRPTVVEADELRELLGKRLGKSSCSAEPSSG